MDSTPSKQSKEKREKRPTNYPNHNYEEYANETFTNQRDFTKKRIHYKKGSPTSGSFPPDSQFQIPENDKSRYLPAYDGAFGKSPGVKNNQYENMNQLEDSSFTKHNRTKNYGQQSLQNQNIPDTNKKVMSETQDIEIGKNSSLICKAINYDGEPVIVNDQVVRDKLILSCRPRSHYGVGSYLKRVPVESNLGPRYIYPPTNVADIDDVNIKRRTDIEHHQTISDGRHREYLGTGKPALRRTDAIDAGSLGMGERPSEIEKQGEKYEEQYRAIQCKRYKRNFKVFLWALFIINLLLVIVGLTLLIITLVHMLYRDYINTVIAHTCFVNWIWGVMVLALLIILVGTYGVCTSITRTRRMIIIYCVVAAILAAVILIFLLVFWIMHDSLKTTMNSSMKKTLEVYRCKRWIRTGWDSLHENLQCCGIEAHGDWKYIPTSCCHAENKFQRLACIKHFINEDQAFKSGCRKKLEDYFTTMFLLITCLLILAFILLLLGILAALSLLKMFKVVLLCRDTYLITP